MKLFRRVFLLPLVLLLGGLVAACVTSGPQKALNDVADALSKNDGAAFLAQLDMQGPPMSISSTACSSDRWRSTAPAKS